jgi:NADPH:quinone reductase-like Zn-dependent oxidoreductase
VKKIQITTFGIPADVAKCIEAAEVGPPAADEVVFEVLAFPVNPSDLMFCSGHYGLTPSLPACPGAECVGRVVAVGQQVKNFGAGDIVIPLNGENWVQRRKVKAQSVVKIPATIDLRQASMLRINPPTALLMLTDIVPLNRGDWIVQNAANSAVGRLLIALARERGLRTVNIVRREDLAPELKNLGADAVVADGPGLAQRVENAVSGARIALGIDAIGGRDAKRLGFLVGEDGTVCNYGRLSGPDVFATSSDLIVRGIKYTGFWLTRALRNRSPTEIAKIYSELSQRILDGELYAPVEAVYPIDQIGAAISHAQREGRDGKILVSPNGLI